VASEQANSLEALVRARMRRQQAANSALILAVAVAAIGVGAFFAFSAVDWHRPAPPPKTKQAHVVAAPRKPVPAIAAPAPVASSAAPVAALPQPNAAPPTPPPPPKDPRLEPAPMQRNIDYAPPPIRPASEAARNAPVATGDSALGYPSADAAKHMLFSIKCFDELAYEGERGGRQHFSGLCLGGNRMEVSCAGAGCRVEYAPPPSHVP
jgi:hypothetical protein